MSYQTDRQTKSLKRLILLQPDFIYYLAIGIYYVTCALGITPFVFDYKQSGRSHRLQRGRRYHTRHAYLRLSETLRRYNNIMLLITIALTPFTTYTLYTKMYFLNLTKLLTVVGNLRFTLTQGFAAIIMLLNCCMQRRTERFLNRWLRMQYDLRKLTVRLFGSSVYSVRLPHLDRYSCLWLCAKLPLILLTPLHLCYVIKGEGALHRPVLLASLLFNYYCIFVLQMSNFTYCLCAIRLGHYGNQINILLKQAIAESRRHLNGLRPLNLTSRQIVFDLCEVIRSLHSLHARNVRLSHELLRIYSVMLLTFFFSVFAISVVQLFVFYFATCTRYAANYGTGGVISKTFFKDKCSTPNIFGLTQVLSLLPDMCVVVCITHLMQTPITYTHLMLADKSFQLPPPPPATSNSRCCEMKLETVVSPILYSFILFFPIFISHIYNYTISSYRMVIYRDMVMVLISRSTSKHTILV